MPQLTGFPSTPLPGPAGARILGHFPALFRFFDDPIGMLARLREHGTVVALARDDPAFVCVFGGELNREVLSAPHEFRHDEEFIRGEPGTPLGRISRAIININGAVHKRHRQLLMPAFSRRALDAYAEVIVEVAERQVERWPIGEEVDLDARLAALTQAVALRTLFGLDARARPEIGEAMARFIDVLTEPLTIALPLDLPGLPYRRAQRHCGEMLEGLDRLVEEKRRGGIGDRDALAHLMNAVDEDGSRFSQDELIAEASTLFIAGHDTMAKTMTWTMFLLERHPAVLAAVLDELSGVVGGRSVRADDLPRLSLLERVIKESMRLLSAVPMLFIRVVAQRRGLGSYTLPQHANVIVSPFATHREPDIYPDPRRFDPARWERISPTAYEYLPYGAGPRTCLGMTFARRALPLMLATVLQRVHVQIRRDADISRRTRANILRPRHGLPVRLHPPDRRTLEVTPIRGDIHELVELRG